MVISHFLQRGAKNLSWETSTCDSKRKRSFWVSSRARLRVYFFARYCPWGKRMTLTWLCCGRLRQFRFHSLLLYCGQGWQRILGEFSALLYLFRVFSDSLASISRRRMEITDVTTITKAAKKNPVLFDVHTTNWNLNKVVTVFTAQVLEIVEQIAGEGCFV